jgi:hypothetical protein
MRFPRPILVLCCGVFLLNSASAITGLVLVERRRARTLQAALDRVAQQVLERQQEIAALTVAASSLAAARDQDSLADEQTVDDQSELTPPKEELRKPKKPSRPVASSGGGGSGGVAASGASGGEFAQGTGGKAPPPLASAELCADSTPTDNNDNHGADGCPYTSDDGRWCASRRDVRAPPVPSGYRIRARARFSVISGPPSHFAERGNDVAPDGLTASWWGIGWTKPQVFHVCWDVDPIT